jgi:hypothetical protein
VRTEVVDDDDIALERWHETLFDIREVVFQCPFGPWPTSRSLRRRRRLSESHSLTLWKSIDSIGTEHAQEDVCRNLICQPRAKRGCGPEVSTMCPSAIFGPLSLTTLGVPVCSKVTAVTAAA